MKLAIAIPTYNEAKNLPSLISGIRKSVSRVDDLEVHVLIIDDNSPDGTGKLVEKLAKTEKNNKFSLGVLNRPNKEGLGKAYVHGFQELMKENYDFILQMDADLSHNPKYIPQFIRAAKSADFVVGSRYIKGGEIPDWALYRRLQSRLGNLYAQVVLGSKIHDFTGGYNLYSTRLLRELDLSSLQASGYGFLIELKYKALKHSNGTKEVPIVFSERQHGVSKIPKSTIIKNFVLVPNIRFKTAGSNNAPKD